MTPLLLQAENIPPPLLLQKGIDEISRTAAKSDVLDFSVNEFVFPN